MEKSFKLLLPMMPNFIHYEKPAGVRQDGVDFQDQGIPVGSLTESEAEEYAELIKQEFIKHWQLKK